MSKGIDFERYVVAYYQDMGYAASRFAGSKGFQTIITYNKLSKSRSNVGLIDVIAIREHSAFPDKLYYFIDCKASLAEYKRLTDEDKLALYHFSVQYGAIPIIAIKVKKNKEFPEGIAFDYLLDVRVKHNLPFISNEDTLTILKQKGQQIETLLVKNPKTGKHKEIKLNA